MTVRTIQLRERVMERNDAIAAEVRARLHAAGVASLSLLSSPGAGKTTLLERTLAALGNELSIALVAGDLQTSNDAERLARCTRSLVHAVNTDGACHMDARQVSAALDAIDLDATDLLVVENVGNLVCPAAWDLGEDEKVVLFSITEGEDRPLKYPKAFRVASTVVMTKLDLLPHLDFDLPRAVGYVRDVNPRARVLQLSARTGTGMSAWLDTLRARVRKVPNETGR